MADTKRGREKQARDADTRQRERELEEARDRENESEPPLSDADPSGTTDQEPEADETPADASDAETPRCHRRGCDEPAAFFVLERYQEETGKGPVEATAYLCTDHTDEESPANLDHAYDDYVFRVEPLPTDAGSS
ncbi:hypothetical protein ACFQE1_02655 [Halobium palmae]|uniref:Uncharacterized protein n=1 Tax=Halobium palmae TaxID=1776492 RepID=A0ABD5RVY4_9EURY